MVHGTANAVYAEVKPKDAVLWEFIPNRLYSLKSQTAESGGIDVSSMPPISIALIGFSDEKKEHAMRALFAYSEHWQRPWRLVSSEEEAAQIVLLPADSAEEVARWHHWSRKPPRTRLIAYAEQTPENAHWHLTRRRNGLHPSPIEFAALLKRIAVRLEIHSSNDNTLHIQQKNNQIQRGFLDRCFGEIIKHVRRQ